MLGMTGCNHSQSDRQQPAQLPKQQVAEKQSANNQDQSGNINIWPEISSEVKTDDELEAKVTALLQSMTLEQKIAQMMQPEIRDITVEDMRRYGFGSYLNGGGSFPNGEKYSSLNDWVKLADDMYQASIDDSLDGSTIPTMWGTDSVHGHSNVMGATIFPHNIGLGATFNPQIAEDIARATALEVRASGIDWAFAPTVATARDDRWGRTYESYSENPELVKGFSKHVVYGIQGRPGTDFLDENHLLSSIKHFIGDGGTYLGDDQGDNRDTEGDLFALHGQGYVSGLEAGAQIVMASFNSWHGKKVHGYKYLLTDVLKDKMGFDGFVVGDWVGHGQVKGCTNESCPQSINAGLDMFMVPTKAWKPLLENTLQQAKDGTIPVSRIDDAVTRILRVKMRFGLFDQPSPAKRLHVGNQSLLAHQDHRKIARKAVQQSLVLLKNKNQLLPLAPKQNILIAGDGADNIGKQTGGWTLSWQGTGNKNSDFPNGTSIYQGLKQQIESVGGTATLNIKGEYQKKPDAAIVVFGESPYAEGHGDRSDVEFQPGDKSDLALLKRLKADGIPVVSVFITGRPMWVNAELNASDAFVVAWLPGSEGAGVADVILRKANDEINVPVTGKLSFSWPGTPNHQVNMGDDESLILFPYEYGLRYGDTDPLTDNLSEEKPESDNREINKRIYDGTLHSPWLLWLGSDGELQQITSSSATLGDNRYRTIDRFIQEDAIQVEFTTAKNASNPAVIMFKSKSNFREDLRNILLANGALQFSLRLDSPLSAPLQLVTRCDSDTQENCSARLNLTSGQSLELTKWYQVNIPLTCLQAKGMDFLGTVIPMSVTSESAVKFSLSYIGFSEAITTPTDETNNCLNITAE